MTAKAILIDPHAKTVQEIELPDLHYKTMQKAIGDRPLGRAPLKRFLDLWVDEEGLFRAGQAFFTMTGREGALAGKALMLGIDDAGETTSLDQDWDVAKIMKTLPDYVTFVGDADAVEALIVAGKLNRPATYYIQNGVRELIWEWRPDGEKRA